MFLSTLLALTFSLKHTVRCTTLLYKFQIRCYYAPVHEIFKKVQKPNRQDIQERRHFRMVLNNVEKKDHKQSPRVTQVAESCEGIRFVSLVTG